MGERGSVGLLQYKGGDGKRRQMVGKRPVLEGERREFHWWIGKQHRFIFPPHTDASGCRPVQGKCCNLRGRLVHVQHDNVFGIVWLNVHDMPIRISHGVRMAIEGVPFIGVEQRPSPACRICPSTEAAHTA
jgi:hypothetical protein